MKSRTFFIIAIAAVMTLSFAALTLAQNSPATTGGPATMSESNEPAKTQMKESMRTRMEELWKQDEALYNDWTKIDEHYAQMMKITDSNQLKTEMAKHQEMVNNFNTRYMEYQNAWRKDMAMGQMGGSQGMMTGAKSGTDYKRTAEPTSH